MLGFGRKAKNLGKVDIKIRPYVTKRQAAKSLMKSIPTLTKADTVEILEGFTERSIQRHNQEVRIVFTTKELFPEFDDKVFTVVESNTTTMKKADWDESRTMDNCHLNVDEEVLLNISITVAKGRAYVSEAVKETMLCSKEYMRTVLLVRDYYFT